MPLNDAGLPWLDASWRDLRALYGGDRAPHAMLVTGLPGVGKHALTRRLAAWLLCESPGEEACGGCRACARVAAGTHPDLHTCGLEEDAQSIKVDHVRALIDALHLSSQYGGWKVAVIEPAERMNAHSYNALLKTLEEPAGQAVLVLVTAHPARLPATIRSRCQRVTVPTPAHAEARDWLARAGVEQPDLLLRLTGGAPLAAAGLAESDFIRTRGELLDTLLALSGGRADAAQAASTWKDLPLGESVNWLQTVVHDLARLKSPGLEDTLVNEDLRQGLQRLAQQIDLPALFRYLDELTRIRAVSDAALSPQLQVEGLLTPWRDNLESAA